MKTSLLHSTMPDHYVLCYEDQTTTFHYTRPLYYEDQTISAYYVYFKPCSEILSPDHFWPIMPISNSSPNSKHYPPAYFGPILSIFNPTSEN
ncbi:hypothetical protein CEXT_308951 [Caerostris extrusa]|uniref:Uncharacterized protein n=1 Tax=Caerostris extrusa TaxID=172846 RepID=A0AAV4QT32_CAEEX|nr:hypothetical protein CEXT_308951 [Caerostris extrusa]